MTACHFLVRHFFLKQVNYPRKIILLHQLQNDRDTLVIRWVTVSTLGYWARMMIYDARDLLKECIMQETYLLEALHSDYYCKYVTWQHLSLHGWINICFRVMLVSLEERSLWILTVDGVLMEVALSQEKIFQKLTDLLLTLPVGWPNHWSKLVCAGEL